jgi:hypothetical protein
MAQPGKSFQQTLKELWDLLRTYAQQETIGPLKNLGRQLGMGIGGSLSFALGWFLVVLGIMRLLQTHSLPGIGNWFMVHNWTIYILAVVLIALAALVTVREARKGHGLPVHEPRAELLIPDPVLEAEPEPGPEAEETQGAVVPAPGGDERIEP